MDVARFKKKPVLGILRGVTLEQIDPLVDTVIESGLESIELTMNTNNALALIRRAVTVSQKRLMIGAGTVLSMESLKAALAAGATFIVMPVFITEIVAYCVKNKIPVFPGALTPQEIYRAWEGGATMVKVFPAKCFGPEYFKEVKGPFNAIELLACAGVTPQNMGEYFANGASAISIGASVFKKEWLKDKNFKAICSLIKAYLQQLPVP